MNMSARQPRLRLRHLCLLVLAGSLLALASPWLARVWIGFDLFTQLLPQIAGLALAMLVCLLWPGWRGKVAGALLFLAVVAGMSLLSLTHVSPGFDRRARLPEMRVLSVNLWRKNRNPDAVAREIRRNLPDIVAMPEFEGVLRSLPRRLRDILPHHASCPPAEFCFLGLLSRWPIIGVEGVAFWKGPPYLHARIRTPRGIIHVFVVHTLRMPWIRSHYRQVRAMARLVRSGRDEPVIVMGDFNAAPYSYILNIFTRESGLTRHTWLPTWPVRPLMLPQIPIDHVFTSRHFRRVAGPWVGRRVGSDHLPVIVQLQWQ